MSHSASDSLVSSICASDLERIRMCFVGFRLCRCCLGIVLPPSRFMPFFKVTPLGMSTQGSGANVNLPLSDAVSWPVKMWN